MKKLFLVVALCGAVSAQAATYMFSSFIADDVRAINVSTNVHTITNLASTWMFANGAAGASNEVYIQYTNNSGNLITVSNTAVAQYKNLLTTVPIYPPMEGQLTKVLDTTATVNVWTTTNFVAAQETVYGTPATLVIDCAPGSAANATLTLRFTPVVTDLSTKVTYEHPTASLDWVVSFTTAATTTVVLTNAPTYKWSGYNGLRCRLIHNADTDWSGNVWIKKLGLGYWRP